MIWKKILPIIIIFFIIFIIVTPLNFKILNPIIININIIIITIFTSIYLNLTNKTNWFSILIFLVIIGGIIILFLYLNRFAINERSSNNNFLLKNLEIKIIFLILINLILNKSNFINFIIKNILILNYKIKININNESTTILIFNKFSNLILIFIIIYLLLTLISITYICIRKKSSIRIIN